MIWGSLSRFLGMSARSGLTNSMHGFVVEVTGVCGYLATSTWNGLIVPGVCGGCECRILVGM